MKATVIAAVLESRARAQERNAEGSCGVDPCGGSLPTGTCPLCRGLYCALHLNGRTFRVLDSAPDEAPRYRRERHFLCDGCVEVIDRFRLITLPPIPDAPLSPGLGLLESGLALNPGA